MVNFSSAEVIERLLKIYSLKTMKELSIELGFSGGVVANWNARNSIPLDVLLSVSEQKKVSLDWLIKGENKEKQLSNLEELVLLGFKRLSQEEQLSLLGQLSCISANIEKGNANNHGVIGSNNTVTNNNFN